MAEKLNRYVLIIQVLRRYGEQGARFEEIQDYVFRNSGTQDPEDNISQRTFQRYIHNIKDSFGIQIACNGLGYYVIEQESSEQKLSIRLLEAIHLYSLPAIDGSLNGRIQLDERPLKGKEMIPEIIKALRENLKVKFTYQKFVDNSFTERDLDPYGIKEYNNRWYLVGMDSDKKIKVFGLDRIGSFRITPERFTFPKEFNLSEYFRYCFGVTRPDASKTPEIIVLEFSEFTGKYIKTCPLHPSQKVLEETDKLLRISLELFITNELIGVLRSYGSDVKIVSPVALRRKIQPNTEENKA
jgi:predicted DNA-binding transcriptional regulator YafY